MDDDKAQGNDEDLEIDFGKMWPFKKKPSKKPEESTEAVIETDKAKGTEREPGTAEKSETPEEIRKEENEEEIDLSGIGRKLKGIFKAKKEETRETTKEASGEEEEISVDTSAIIGFIDKKKGLIIPALLILFVLYISFSTRMLPSQMLYTEDWARQNIYSFVRSDISSVINAQYPNLPDERKAPLVDDELNKAIKSNSYTLKTGQYQGQTIDINQQVKASADQFKTFFQDDKGNMYMPDIDPYYWLRYARNIADHGYPGDILKDGKSYDTLQLAPNGRFVEPEDTFHPYSLAYLFFAWKIFDPNITLMYAEMMYPVLISAIIVLLVFLIARRIMGDAGGLFAGVMMAISPSFLTRSLFGHGDSDTWVLFFSVLAAYLFLNALEAKKMKFQIIFAALGGLTIGVYSRFWGGWWYIFDFLLAATAMYAVYLIIAKRNQIKIIQLLTDHDARAMIIVLLTFVLFSGVFVSILSGPDTFILSPVSSLGFTRIKAPVMEGNIWPNVLTTVAELNEGDINSILGNIGGLFIFYVSLLGIMLTMTKRRLGTTEIIFTIISAIWWLILLLIRNEIHPMAFLLLLAIPILARVAYAAIKSEHIDMKLAALLIIWFIVTMYASEKGIRFVMLLAPALSIGFGVAIGFVYTHLIKLTPKALGIDRRISITAVSLLIIVPLLFILLIPPSSIGATARSIARQDTPMINDAWYNALTAIRDGSNKTAIITSWWDFGHHFKALAERPVTFDGTTQGSPQAHWVGQILRTDNEEMAVGILRMLDCGGNNAFEELQKTNGNDGHKSIDTLYDIFEDDKNTAKKTLTKKYGLSSEQAENVLKYTHCNPPEGFFIASEDMIGKSGVWAHFGSWNFERAYIWQNLKEKSIEDATKAMQEKFNYTQEQAEQTYYDMQSKTNDAEANSWISPWPGYGQIDSCRKQGDTAVCNNGIRINLTNNDAYFTNSAGGTGHPKSITYLTETGVETKAYPESAIDLSATLVPEGENYKLILSSPELNASMFTKMFFMQGHSLRHFKPFTTQRSITGAEIYVYKVNWEGGSPNIKAELAKKENVSTGDKVTFNYIGYLEDGQVFDSSINNWKSSNITKDAQFNENSSPFTFTTGNKEIIPGLEEEMTGMKKGEEKVIKVSPEKAYGTDPNAHPLGNKTLYFKIRIENIK